MKKILWIVVGLFGCLLASPSVAQPLHLRLYGGLETHGHGDLKRFQKDQQRFSALGSQLKVVESYPAHIGVGAEVLLGLGANLKAGLVAGYSSTGGRAHYEDYSGAQQIDQVLHRWYGGLTVEMRPLPIKSLWLLTQLRYSRSTLAFTEWMRLGTQSNSDEAAFEGGGLSVAPAIAFAWQRGPVEARLVAGFEYSLIFPFLKGDLSNTLYFDGRASTLQTAWTGIRLGLTLGLNAGGL